MLKCRRAGPNVTYRLVRGASGFWRGQSLVDLVQGVSEFWRGQSLVDQAYHAFRHIAKMGLDKAKVQKAVTASVRELAKQIEPGKPFMQTITVDGHKLHYTAYLLRDGLINVGRIHGVP